MAADFGLVGIRYTSIPIKPQMTSDLSIDAFDYIEMVYNAKRRHGFNNQLSPVEFEKRYTASLESV